MKIQQKKIVIFASLLFFLISSFSAITAKADSLSDETEELMIQETIIEEEASSPSDEESLPENTTVSVTAEEASTSFDAEALQVTENRTEEESSIQSNETAIQEMAEVTEKTNELTFSICVEYSSQGYCVIGTLSDFPTGIVHIQPLCSQDDKIYHECGDEWDANQIKALHVAETKQLICLYSNFEPLKSYLEGSLDRFYLKLRFTKDNGVIYETQTALIDRGTPQPLPEEITFYANFPSNMRVREMKPFRYYGKYQITVRETAVSQDISALLPDMLPIEVQLLKKGTPFADAIVDCPVTWKSLSLPSLTAGESVTIEDAAEEIVIPGGTLLHTPVGVFRLDEPFGIAQDILTDEILLVLNVVSKDEKPTGVLIANNDGLEMAFHQKPTGATSIRAYTISANETKWTEIPELALLKAIDSQPSTASSGYALVLRTGQEPYRSYLAAEATGATPTPFFIGLKIQGGVYDGQQLILAWPGNYELPLSLPKLGGIGGNESNAGAGNKGDSTEEGQRPNLPQNSDTKKEEQNPNLSQSQNMDNQNSENQNSESTMELPTESDVKNQQTQKDGSAPGSLNSSAFTQPSTKVQAAIAVNTEESISETIPATDAQTDTHTENMVPKTPSVETRLSAALVPANQNEKTGHQPFLWIMSAAIIIIGIILYTRKKADT